MVYENKRFAFIERVQQMCMHEILKKAFKESNNVQNISLRVVEWVALIRFLFGMWHY